METTPDRNEPRWTVGMTLTVIQTAVYVIAGALLVIATGLDMLAGNGPLPHLLLFGCGVVILASVYRAVRFMDEREMNSGAANVALATICIVAVQASHSPWVAALGIAVSSILFATAIRSILRGTW
jgi:hypothetical protein